MYLIVLVSRCRRTQPGAGVSITRTGARTFQTDNCGLTHYIEPCCRRSWQSRVLVASHTKHTALWGARTLSRSACERSSLSPSGTLHTSTWQLDESRETSRVRRVQVRMYWFVKKKNVYTRTVVFHITPVVINGQWREIKLQHKLPKRLNHWICQEQQLSNKQQMYAVPLSGRVTDALHLEVSITMLQPVFQLNRRMSITL